MSALGATAVWMRRDLRLCDHPALNAALHMPGPVQPVFIFDTEILARFSDPHDRRLSFIAQTCRNLHKELQKRGGGLLVLYGKPSEIWPILARALNIKHICAAEDYEPATQKRDLQVKAALGGIAELRLLKDHVIMTPSEVLKDDGTPYKVFTPYSNRWRERLTPTSCFEYAVHDKGRYGDFAANAGVAERDGLEVIDASAPLADMLSRIGYRPADISLWPPEDAQSRLDNFIGPKTARYAENRDFMGMHGTSRLSPYIRFGLISIRECVRRAGEVAGSDTWIKELIWRDFYQMILYHFPHTPTQEFNPAYRSIDWSNDETLLERFTQGQTGFPIIDAAMRELLATGWMHNRARMIVASFMTKDLLLDWRLGEAHFAKHLMDYELASNVGGWQWAASTGTDAQPYFRIFNPVLQSKKFDPEGEYIRRFVPELALLPVSDIHEPWKKVRPANYPAPIVQHDEMRVKAIAMFKQAEMRPPS